MGCRGIPRWLRLSGVVFVSLLAGGAGHVQAGNPKVLDTCPYPRVAILVFRMGNPDGYLRDIASSVDYRNRVPSDKQDVCIEDEKRLKEAFPDYPKQSRSRLPKTETEFYGNVTAPLTGVLRSVLEEKGKAVIIASEAAAGWPQQPAEMSMQDILRNLQGKADALLVAHYLDAGNKYWDTVNAARTDKGFSLLSVKLALFNVTTGQIAARQEIGFNPMAIIAVDPSITDDPALKGKIRVQEKADKNAVFDQGFLIKERRGLFASEYTLTGLGFTRAEVEEYALRHFRNGYAGPSKMHHFAGVASVIQCGGK
ncbi:MAG: hypothetical protein AB1714_18835 [Acidobacteriota bacterium]